MRRTGGESPVGRVVRNCSSGVGVGKGDRGSPAPARPRVPLISVAPMMAVTNRHWRYLARKLTSRTELYTEMLVDKALILGDIKRSLNLLKGFPGELDVAGEAGLCCRSSPAWNSREAAEEEVERLMRVKARQLRHVSEELASTAPMDRLETSEDERERKGMTVVQLGGGIPEEMARAAQYCVAAGYQAININCGCPSPKLVKHDNQRSRFGAVLMLEPQRIASMIQAMREATTLDGMPLIDITVKCRVGLDKDNDQDFLNRFVSACRDSGVRHMIIHARNAIISTAISPKSNLAVPPLRFDAAYALLEEFPDMAFTVNGEISTTEQIREHLERGASGVMIGRAARDRMWLLNSIDEQFFDDKEKGHDRVDIAREFANYAENEFYVSREMYHQREKPIVQPLMGLFNECIGATAFRSALEEEMSARKALEKRLSKKAIAKLSSCSRAAVEAAILAYESRLQSRAQ